MLIHTNNPILRIIFLYNTNIFCYTYYSSIAKEIKMIQTQTINIEYVQKVLKYCPNFDSIVNYDYEYGDTLSSMLIDWYRELVFSADGNNEKQLTIISFIDKSLSMYVKDRRYKRGLSKVLTVNDISLNNKGLIKELIKKIVLFTNNYEKKKILEITNPKWL